MDVLSIAAMGAICIACFLTGAKVGQAVEKGEKIETPTINPLKAYQARQAEKESEMEQHRLDIILQNIEAYDGTGKGQEDVPGR